MDKLMYMALVGIGFILFGIACLLLVTEFRWIIMLLPGIVSPFIGMGIIIFSMKISTEK